MKLSKKQIESILDQDAAWHKGQAGLSGHSSAWEIGFVRGIEHARGLLISCMQANDISRIFNEEEGE